MTGCIPHINMSEFPNKISLLWWQEKGLMYTASGYGRKIPTTRMLKYCNRWRRIYVTIFSNIGSCYIMFKGKPLYVNEY